MAGADRRRRVPSYRRFWDTIPPRSFVHFLIAVFCNFATIGFVSDVMGSGQASTLGLVLMVLASGLVAVAYAYAVTRSMWLFGVIVPLQILVFIAISRLTRPVPDSPDAAAAALSQRLMVDGIGIIAGVTAGYAFFVLFIAREGNRHFRVHTEMSLARELHDSLVPPIALAVAGCEIHGRSLPAAEMGGDLLDVVERDGVVTCYVADVSGHGVRAGAVMGMVKASTRTMLAADRPIELLLGDLNRLLLDLTRPGTFVTAAVIQIAPGGAARYAFAGHLPILHCDRAGVRRLAAASVALGLARDRTFAASTITLAPDDVLVLLTDGMTEVFDRQRRELGLEPLEEVLRASGGEPVAGIAAALVACTERHGTAHDDRTVLVVRHG